MIRRTMIERVMLLISGVLALFILISLTACGVAAAAPTIPDPVIDAPLSATSAEQTAVVAGGCFWGVQAVFQHVKGVIRVTSGYSGGSAETAYYEEVCSDRTGHAEAVSIVYDPSKTSYGQLLKVFFAVAHDPTQRNRQGPDTGTQYRSVIFYANEDQKHIAQSYVDQLNKARSFPRPVVTGVVALDSFYPAESYHQDYATRHPDNPYIVINDLPKLEALRKLFPELYVSR